MKDVLDQAADIVNDQPTYSRGTGMDAWLYLTRKRAHYLEQGMSRDAVDKLIADEDGYPSTWSPD